MSLFCKVYFESRVMINKETIVKQTQLVLISCPKARGGHRYPCPALVFCNGSSDGSRAAAPEGTGGDEVL